jgi:hypothetical protein
MYTARFPRDKRHGGQALARPVVSAEVGEYLYGIRVRPPYESFEQARLHNHKLSFADYVSGSYRS